MRALCWKELRENWRWALLAAVGLGFAQWYALNHGKDEYTLGYSWSGDGLLLDSSSFLAVTTFGCALAGLLLGFVQILPELRRDQWASAAASARPARDRVSREGRRGSAPLHVGDRAALSLQRLAGGHARTFRAAPFVPETALAGTADICVGGAFYFAALAMALPRGGVVRRARVPAAGGVARGVLRARRRAFPRRGGSGGADVAAALHGGLGDAVAPGTAARPAVPREIRVPGHDLLRGLRTGRCHPFDLRGDRPGTTFARRAVQPVRHRFSPAPDLRERRGDGRNGPGGQPDDRQTGSSRTRCVRTCTI